MLERIPEALIHERALVQAKLGQHTEVLKIYVEQLEDPGMAEQYCADVYERAVGGGLDGLDLPQARIEEDKDVYLDLLEVYRNQQASGDSRGEEHMQQLLVKHFNRLDPVKVMGKLPQDMKLAKVQAYLERVMRWLESERRTMQIKHQLLKVHHANLSHQETKMQIEQQSNMNQVPQLAKYLPVRTSLPPEALSEGDSYYEVFCHKHICESFVILQFKVRNKAEAEGGLGGDRGGQTLKDVIVNLHFSDEDIYELRDTISLPTLPTGNIGSCYVVLKTNFHIGHLETSVTCELQFTTAKRPGTYPELIPLQDLELKTSMG